MADHGFLQAVEGSGTDPVPQIIDVANSWGPSINDDGVIAFGHTGEFPLDRTVVSVSDGATITQVHGGGFKSPATGILGIDGHGQVYLFTSPPDPSCPPTTSNCIVRADGVVIASASDQSTPRNFLVNGGHPRLQAGTSRVVYYADTANGVEYRTEAGLVAASGSELSSIVAGEHDINASGEIVFLGQTVNGFGIFAGRAGEAMRAIFLNYNNPSGIGFVSIHSPRIDDSGAVFFSATGPGEQQYKVYRIDPGSQEPVLLVDGNTGPLVLPSSAAVAVNGAGTLAFLATRASAGALESTPDRIPSRTR